MKNFSSFFVAIKSVVESIADKNANKVIYYIAFALIAIVIFPVLLLIALIYALRVIARHVFDFVVAMHKYFCQKYKYGRFVVPAIAVVTIATIAIFAVLASPTAKVKSPADYKEATIREMDNKDRLYGVDLSKYQRSTYKSLIDDDDVDIVIARATYGKTVDAYCDAIFQYAMRQHKLLGTYFFVNQSHRLDYDARKHARWAADQIRGYIGKSIFILDMENENTNSNVLNPQWAEEWLEEFERATGIKPFLYINRDAENINGWSDAVTSYPLWIADYTVSAGQAKTTHWDKWIIHQYSDNPVDRDVFYGSAENWWAYVG